MMPDDTVGTFLNESASLGFVIAVLRPFEPMLSAWSDSFGL